MQPVIFQGQSAFSEFRLKALIKALNEADHGFEVTSIDALQIYLIEAGEPL